ncbi:MAG TPA: NPCBM/NEW2 domain-containing protein, partial [Flavobacterium sp.]|uniref:NPCBM/NEW2 domain-containing protein n=1 Tax=Flavobacterium sp. TaxID=239 RepID=UPI002DB8DEDA
YLVVNDGGDKTDWDHANWIEPTLYNEKGAVKLTSLKWIKATSGWEKVKVNQSVSGNALIVNKVKYEDGIGTHSNSIIEFDIPEGYTHFKALVGLDDACVTQNTGATVKFFVFTENPSGPAPPPSAKISIDLKGIGFSDKCVITDLWSGKVVGKFSGEFAPEINQHGAGLYKIVKVSK